MIRNSAMMESTVGIRSTGGKSERREIGELGVQVEKCLVQDIKTKQSPPL